MIVAIYPNLKSVWNGFIWKQITEDLEKSNHKKKVDL